MEQRTRYLLRWAAFTLMLLAAASVAAHFDAAPNESRKLLSFTLVFAGILGVAGWFRTSGKYLNRVLFVLMIVLTGGQIPVMWVGGYRAGSILSALICISAIGGLSRELKHPSPVDTPN